jgi:hypothetical protein
MFLPACEPLHWQQSIFWGHVVRQSEPTTQKVNFLISTLYICELINVGDGKEKCESYLLRNTDTVKLWWLNSDLQYYTTFLRFSVCSV